MMKRCILALTFASVPLLVLAGCGSSSSSSSAPAKVAVQAGVNDPQDSTIAALTFLPSSVTVKVGATVEWTVPGSEPHTITFLPVGQTPPPPDKPENAALRGNTTSGAYDGTQTFSSTIIPQGPQPATYSISFPKAGAYTYYCIIHPGMAGQVNVVTDGSKADHQSAIDARARSEQAQWLAEGRAAKQRLVNTPVKKTANADGTTTWTIQMGTGTQHTTVLAFQPVTAEIKAGDRVTFLNDTNEPHTATFSGSKVLPQNPESPEAMAPAPGASPQTLNATDMFNTGWLPPNEPPGQGPPEAARSYTYIVKQPGTYTYVCLLHAPSKMGGVLNVS